MEKVSKQLKVFIIERLKEKTTWYGIAGLLAAFGIALTPEQQDAITMFGLALASLIAIFTQEK